jgi:predicted ArsR family transcriptional regulator
MWLFSRPDREKVVKMDASWVLRPDTGSAHGFGGSRARVLAVLQDAGEALSVGQVAARVGLHPNTTRFHLDGLVGAGVADRAVEDRDRPGRPRTLYTARPGSPPSGQRSYRLLAEILTGYLASETEQPAQAAQRAGQVWGRYLSRRPPPFRRTDAATATRQLVETLDEIGFAPEAVTTGEAVRILLRHCPFRETAEQHREVVCSVHLGLMRGVLDELAAPVQTERLEPFVEPGLCVAHLALREAADRPGR